jgi:hypothetical protein
MVLRARDFYVSLFVSEHQQQRLPGRSVGYGLTTFCVRKQQYM